MAVSTGLARHVLVYRTVTESSVQGQADAGPSWRLATASHPRDRGIWLQPFGSVSAVNWLAPVPSGTSTSSVPRASNSRRSPWWSAQNAADNPSAVFRDPLTLDDYLSARMISSPLCLFDCDIPVDGSTAFVVSHVDTAADAPRPPVHVNAVGTRLHGPGVLGSVRRPDLDGCRRSLGAPVSRTDLPPADVDVASLYDGFSILTLVWLEALGFCAHGEGRHSSRAVTASVAPGSCPSTPPAGSFPRGGCTASGTSTRRCSSSGAARRPSGPRGRGRGGGQRRRTTRPGCCC